MGAAQMPRADGAREATLVVTRPVAHDWSPNERRLLTGLAYQAEPALARALLAEREHVAAETLQRSLLPRRLPARAHVALAARYEPAVVGDRVGGDWYDAWWTADDRLLLVVGDVVGHGIEAAATMGRLRTSIRALSEVDPAPARIVTRLAVAEGRDGTEMVATVLVALLDPDRRRLTVCRAGHLPLLLVAPGKEAVFVDDLGAPPLGCAAVPVTEIEVDAPDGSLMVLYTDGLVEDRSSSIDDGLQLIARTTSQRQDLADPVEAVADALMAARPLGSSQDDVALLVVHLRRGAEQSSTV
jgi:serine phosphatase RsbU (regulator of sigma subunit)